MEIICPECQFTRVVDETKIPAKSQVATCPKCQTKFRFRDIPEEAPVTEPVPQPEPQEPAAPSNLAQGSLLSHAQPEAEEIPVESEPQVVSRPAPKPPVEESEPTFPPISAPGESSHDVWDKLDSMTPPEEAARPEEKKPEQVPHQAPQQTPPPMAEEQQPVPGWTGEFNDDFPDPMQDDSDDHDDEEAGLLVPPPFEQLDRYGFFHGLYMTIKLVLTSPRLFFSVMPVGGGLAKPLTFTILLTMIQGFVQYFWSMAGLSTTVTPDGADAIGGVSGALAPVVMLLFMPAFIAAGQFMITGIYHILLKLMRGDNQGFEGTFRALAYANAPIVLGLFPMLTPEIEIVWMAITAIWGLFLTIVGLKNIHKTSYGKVVPVALIPLLLGMIAALAVFQQQFPTI